MKKLLFSFIVGLLVVGNVYADNMDSLAKSGFVMSTGLVYVDKSWIDNGSNSSYGFDFLFGYDKAINQHVTVGVKTGYRWARQDYDAVVYPVVIDETVITSIIPALITAKYFFNNGVYLGGEGGINFQYTNIRPYDTWKSKAVIGGIIGYQWKQHYGVNLTLDHVMDNKPQESQIAALHLSYRF